MKTRILLMATLIATLTSCASAIHDDWQKHQDKECATRITKFNYEGHSYLLYRHNNAESITHDANCDCYKIPDSDY